jgi:hypothetical protein
MSDDTALLVSIFLWLVLCLLILPMPQFGKDRDEDT